MSEKQELAKLVFQALWLIDDKDIEHAWNDYRRTEHPIRKDDFSRVAQVLLAAGYRLSPPAPELTGDNTETIVNQVIDWLKPYLKKTYGVGTITEGHYILEWVITDKYGDILDEPFLTIEKLRATLTQGEGR